MPISSRSMSNLGSTPLTPATFFRPLTPGRPHSCAPSIGPLIQKRHLDNSHLLALILESCFLLKPRRPISLLNCDWVISSAEKIKRNSLRVRQSPTVKMVRYHQMRKAPILDSLGPAPPLGFFGTMPNPSRCLLFHLCCDLVVACATPPQTSPFNSAWRNQPGYLPPSGFRTCIGQAARTETPRLCKGPMKDPGTG